MGGLNDGVTGVGRLECVRTRMMGGHLGGGAALVPAAPRLRPNLVALAVSVSITPPARPLAHAHDSSVACLDANMFGGPLLRY